MLAPGDHLIAAPVRTKLYTHCYGTATGFFGPWGPRIALSDTQLQLK